MDCSNVSINAHSSIRIGGSAVLWFDPFHVTDEPHDADVILVTHEHFDHLSPEDIARVARDDTRFVVPCGMEGQVTALGVSTAQVTGLAPGESAQVCGVAVEAVPAYNLDKQFHPRERGWVGYVATLDGVRYYVAGDTDDLPENRSLACDVALVPVGGTYTMTAPEAAAFVNALAPTVAIPTHYGDVAGSPEDGRRFASLVDAGIQVEVLI